METDVQVVAAIEALTGPSGWCDRSIDTLRETILARTGTRPHTSTIYRQLERLRGAGRIETTRRRVCGRTRTCHRVLLRQSDDAALELALRRIAQLELRIAQLTGQPEPEPAPAANGEAERLVAEIAGAQVHVAQLPDGPAVIAEEDVPRVEAAGIEIRRRSAWPRGATRPRGPLGLTAVREALAGGEDAESLRWLLTWYHAATLDDSAQVGWWGCHMLTRPRVRARARGMAVLAERRHRARLEAAMRGPPEVGPPARPIEADERSRAAGVLERARAAAMEALR